MSRGEPKPAKDARRSGHGKGHPKPGLPGVNLLSPATFDLLAVRRLRLRFLAGAVALVVLTAGLWTVQHLRISETRKLVAVEQAETARLNSETRVLLPVKAYVAGVAAQQATVKATMSREIYFSRVLDGIRRATPVGASLDNLAVTLAVPDPAAAGADARRRGADGLALPGPGPVQHQARDRLHHARRQRRDPRPGGGAGDRPGPDQPVRGAVHLDHVRRGQHA